MKRKAVSVEHSNSHDTEESRKTEGTPGSKSDDGWGDHQSPPEGNGSALNPSKLKIKKKKKDKRRKRAHETEPTSTPAGTGPATPDLAASVAAEAGTILPDLTATNATGAAGSALGSPAAAVSAERADEGARAEQSLGPSGGSLEPKRNDGNGAGPSGLGKEGRRLGKTHGRARKDLRRESSGQREENQSQLSKSGAPGQGKPRKHTLSIAIPGSVVDNAQNRELKTYLVGEIARAAAIFEVDEIVVYDDLSVSRKGQGGVRDDSANGSLVARTGQGSSAAAGSWAGDDRRNPNIFMARLLQYAETPQYLRKQLFPMHPTLRLAGLLNPLDAPHHMRADDDCPYREGVVLDRVTKKGAGSFVDVGKRKEARIDRPLEAGVRVTVKFDKGDPCKKNHKGRAVAPSAPREELGLYWGYQTRLASGMADVLAGCPFKGGYDLTVGTSERGNVTVDSNDFALPSYRHLLVVFGGVQGIEATVDADETLQLPGSEASALFDMWVNTCPGQGSRTIRTEEAVLITLARLRPLVLGNTGDASAMRTRTDG